MCTKSTSLGIELTEDLVNLGITRKAMAGDLKHIHDAAKAEEFARALGLQIGGGGHPFVGPWGTKGLYAYKSGKYSGMAFFRHRRHRNTTFIDTA